MKADAKTGWRLKGGVQLLASARLFHSALASTVDQGKLSMFAKATIHSYDLILS